MRHLLAAFAFAPFAVVVACSVTSTTPDGTGAAPTSTSPTQPPPGSSGSSGSSGTSGSSGKPQGCTPDPTCDRARCPCPNGEELATTGVCRGSDGQCAVMDACNAACGASVSFAESEHACKDDMGCSTGAPFVDCSCNDGQGWTAYAACAGGYCSGKPSDVCPKSCKNDDGWVGCATAAECADTVCPCNDGKATFPAGICASGTCASAEAVCPDACSKHGGYKGGTTTADAGPGGPKNPGDPCTKGSECKPWSCACNNGQSFANNMMCISNQCPTQADACGFVCLSSGGWSGH